MAHVLIFSTSGNVATAKSSLNSLLGYPEGALMRIDLSNSGSAPASHHICSLTLNGVQLEDVKENISGATVHENMSLRKILRDNSLKIIRE